MNAVNVSVEGVSAYCPHCGVELCDTETGSLTIYIQMQTEDHKYRCIGCGKRSKLPKSIFREINKREVIV